MSAGSWGAKDIDDFMRIAEDVHLDGVVEKIRVPFLVTHGEKDSQIPLKWAHRTYEQLVNSPQRELKVFTEREGGVQHSSFDNSINARPLHRRLGGRSAAGPHPRLSPLTARISHEDSGTGRPGVRRGRYRRLRHLPSPTMA